MVIVLYNKEYGIDKHILLLLVKKIGILFSANTRGEKDFLGFYKFGQVQFSKYADMSEKFGAWDDSEMNHKDLNKCPLEAFGAILIE